MTISVYTILEKGRELCGPFSSVEVAVKECKRFESAIIYIDGLLLEEMIDLGLEIEPSSIESGLLGHVGYIDRTPIVTDRFAAQPVLPQELSRSIYVSYPPTR